MGPWRWVGDRALLRTFTGPVTEGNAAARALARRVEPLGEVEDAVPGAASVLVTLRPGIAPGSELVRALESPPAPNEIAPTAHHEIDVVYDGEDLDDVARLTGLGADEIVALHSGDAYTVAFLGFSPGFGYLLGLPQALHVPRLDTPRVRVPAGAVAIAGEWAGIYPSATPGGWRLLGRTEAALFDARRDPPATLAPGDRVRFRPSQ